MPEAKTDLAFLLRRPFDEQVAFFRGKLKEIVPTARWDDLRKSQHDRAFMVAGAAKADLLADLAASVVHFSLTDVGLAAAVSQAQCGLDLSITHVQLGSDNRIPNGSETALIVPRQAVPIDGGSKPAPNQLRLAARFSSGTGYPISEIGLFAGDPNAGGVLFAYWSQPSGAQAEKFPGIDFVFSYDMVLGAGAPGNISIQINPDGAQALALVASHEGRADPHPQYALRRSSAGLFVDGADWGDLSKPMLLGEENTYASLAFDLAPDGQGEAFDYGTIA